MTDKEIMSPERPSMSPTNDPEQQSTISPMKHTLASWWWWWEIGAVLISIVTMSLVVAVLIKCEDMPLSAWPFPIQPNSLIAAFTTVSKTAMIIAITSCISQLKWQYFRKESRPLHHVQILDDASRGPWGALVLLYRIRTHSWLICSLAVVMVAALGIETTAQQVFEYPTRDTELMLNGTAIPQISVADCYQESIEYICENEYTQYDPRCLRERALLQISMGNAIGGAKVKSDLLCPSQAKYCSFPAFTSLAMCSKVENYTDTMTVNCDTNENLTSVCSYRWHDLNAARLGISNETINRIEMTFNNRSINTQGDDTYVLHDRLKTSEIYPLSDGYGPSLSFLRTQDSSEYYGNGSLPRVELLGVYWKWCVHSFTPTNITSLGSTAAPTMEEILAGPIDQTVNNDIRIYTANSTGRRYQISSMTDWLLGNVVYDSLKAHVMVGTMSANDSNGTRQIPTYGTESTASMVGLYLSVVDIEDVARNVAATISSFVRTPDNTTSIRANRNATFITGKAFIEETYIRVRWQWLILPLLETLLTATLLVVTIILDRRLGYPLLKASTLGLLFHGIEGWVPGDLKDHISAVDTAEGLEGMAKKIRVRFISDEDGKLKFVRCG